MNDKQHRHNTVLDALATLGEATYRDILLEVRKTIPQSNISTVERVICAIRKDTGSEQIHICGYQPRTNKKVFKLGSGTDVLKGDRTLSTERVHHLPPVVRKCIERGASPWAGLLP